MIIVFFLKLISGHGKHHGLLDVRVPAKTNNEKRENMDDHFCASFIRYLFELGAAAPGEMDMYSCDDKAKLKVGSAAVSGKINALKYMLRQEGQV